MSTLIFRRKWLLLGLALLAGLTAFVLTRNVADTFERKAVFVLRPGADISDAQIPDAVRGISQQDAQLVQTVSRVIETDRFLGEAFLRGVSTPPDPKYILISTITPGTDVITVVLEGPEPEVLEAVMTAFAEEASQWVSDVYRAYELELLENTAPEESVSAGPLQSIVVAMLLGLLIGIGFVFAESKTRQKVALQTAPPRRVDPGSGESEPESQQPRSLGNVRLYSGEAKKAAGEGPQGTQSAQSAQGAQGVAQGAKGAKGPASVAQKKS